MRKALLILCGVTGLMVFASAKATDLLDVYQQAMKSDPTFLQAISQQRADDENVPIALSALYPHLGIASTGTLSKIEGSGAASSRATVKERAYTFGLTLTQQLYNPANRDALTQAREQASAGDATFNAALQQLMSTVATTYFTVLKAEEDERYSRAKKNVYERQLEQTEQQYKVGLKTQTDVALAKSSYESALASEVSSANDLANAHENLRAITGVDYPVLDQLQQDFPLISPDPLDPAAWVTEATTHNWQLQADRLAAKVAQKNIDLAEDTGMPTLNVQAVYNQTNTHAYGDVTSATNHTAGPSLIFNFAYPLWLGGQVTASTRQAVDLYEVADQTAEATYRTTVNQTRQDYLKILATITKIRADKQAMISGESALQGAFAGYKVGTKTLVDILTAQETLFQAQSNYAQDRLTYITTSLNLKQDTGSLAVNDLKAVNAWLIPPAQPLVKKNTTATAVTPHNQG